ncbi:uncharacterized protein LOC133903132 [Phragmites australis]|uniref:uncharacterized protein LOC133903132 n=1 Tax=Phragmites australis TaxID=29695 RepID=UPI002D79E978|nr:uncharacterized protein LOC133903132 [Phragmites australis]
MEKRRHKREQLCCEEVAGGTAAECAVMCHFFPCTVVELIVLVMVRVALVLCRRAIWARCRRTMAKKKEMEDLLVADATSPRSRAAAVAKANKKAEATEHWPTTHSSDELVEEEKKVEGKQTERM